MLFRPMSNINFFSFFFYLFLSSLAFSNNLIELLLSWVGLNISLYALFVKGSTTSVEAGLKYFLVGLFVTCLLFFSIVLFFMNYLSFDITHLGYITSYSHKNLGNNSIFIFSSLSQRFLVVSIVAAFLFKLGSFPFSFYVSDVYDNVSWRVLYLYTVPLKIVIFIVFLKILTIISFSSPPLTPLLVWSGIGSIIFGSFSAMLQTRFRRFWAFSYISTIGFVILSVLIYNEGLGLATYVSKLYLLVYILTWQIIFSIFSNYRVLVNFSNKWLELTILSQTHWLKKSSKTNLAAHSLAISLVSLMGLPPALGFFSKFIAYTAMFEMEYGIVLFLVLLSSPISALGYLRILTKLITRTKSTVRPSEAIWVNPQITTGFTSVFELSCIIFWIPMLSLFFSILFSALSGLFSHSFFNSDTGLSESVYSQIFIFIIELMLTLFKFTFLVLSWLI